MEEQEQATTEVKQEISKIAVTAKTEPEAASQAAAQASAQAPAAARQVTISWNHGQKSWSVAAWKVKTVAALGVVCLGALVGTLGWLGNNYRQFHAQQAAFNEYKEHKEAQDAKLQSLLDDNEKMLRDMSVIHTLETKLRRAVIRSSDDKDFTSNVDNVGAGGTKETDPGYLGKGGPAEMDGNTVAVLEAQNKNLAHQIDQQKSNMNELLSTLEGRSNKRSAFPDLWPTNGGTISSAYGGRTGPIAGGYDWHPGVDIAVDFGTPIYASAMGTVEQAGWNGGYGRYVRLDHGNGYESAYGHMSGIAVVPGQVVRKGEIIGFVGSSGYSTGPHVHFEVLVDGSTIDPMYMLNLGLANNK